MPSPINVTLRGYLDFFGLKNGGMNPQQPASFLQPVMELQRWYLESRAIDYTWSFLQSAANANASVVNLGATSPSNISTGTDVLVPQSEVWVLLPGTRINVLFDALATQLGEGILVAVGPNGIVTQELPFTQLNGQRQGNATVRVSGTVTLAQQYWLQPGYSLRLRHFGIIAGAGDVLFTGTLRLVRLRV